MPGNYVPDAFGADIGTLAEQLGATPSTATGGGTVGSGSGTDWGSVLTGIATGISAGLGPLVGQPVTVVPQPSYGSGSISTGTMLLLGGAGVLAFVVLGRKKGRR